MVRFELVAWVEWWGAGIKLQGATNEWGGVVNIPIWGGRTYFLVVQW